MTRKQVEKIISKHFNIIMPTHFGWMIMTFNPLRKSYHLRRMEKLIEEEFLPVEIEEGNPYHSKFNLKYKPNMALPNALTEAEKFVEENPAFHKNKEYWKAKISGLMLDFTKKFLSEKLIEDNPILSRQNAVA